MSLYHLVTAVCSIRPATNYPIGYYTSYLDRHRPKVKVQKLNFDWFSSSRVEVSEPAQENPSSVLTLKTTQPC
jgi:hypothetical protein